MGWGARPASFASSFHFAGPKALITGMGKRFCFDRGVVGRIYIKYVCGYVCMCVIVFTLFHLYYTLYQWVCFYFEVSHMVLLVPVSRQEIATH